MSIAELLRQEWTVFRRPGRLIALAAAALAVIAVGLLGVASSQASCPGRCPAVPVADDGSVVSDHFWFLHRGLGREGSLTVRMTAMTGTITYPPPNHDQIVPGLVPWAKSGIIVKDGVRQGSTYAALAMTGHHGLRFQYDYRGDVAAGDGDTSTRFPRWLRLTRSGDTITGAESTDGRQWHTVATTTLHRLPDTVQVGLFATSPGDLTLRKVGLGGALEEVRFTQAVGVFDHVAVVGGAAGAWRSESVGEMNQTDWEKYHNPSGAVVRDDVITVSGTGDIGPLGEAGRTSVDQTLPGLVIALIVVIVVGARYGVRTARQTTSAGVVTVRAAVVGTATLVTGLVAVGVVLPVGIAVLRHNGVQDRVPALTAVRVIVGVAMVLALCAVLAFGLGGWLRRGWTGVLAALSLVALPFAVATLPLLPDTVSQWLLRLTPAAGFAVQQTLVEYPQASAHYAPSAGYFPLPGWAGLAVLSAYATMAVWVAAGKRTAIPPTEPRADSRSDSPGQPAGRR